MPLSSRPVPYVVLLPVKPPGHGKSRLGDLPRDQLATAFAMDAATACLSTPSVQQVLVITDDARFAAALSALGCAAIPDGVAGDLNGSLVLAAREAARRWPDLVPVAVCADLPCLTADDLEDALAQGAGRHRFVADASGHGTTLYTAPHESFAPEFGFRSAALHREGGAQAIGSDLPRLRRDVDDAVDLTDAIKLGVGAHTALVVAGLPAEIV